MYHGLVKIGIHLDIQLSDDSKKVELLVEISRLISELLDLNFLYIYMRSEDCLPVNLIAFYFFPGITGNVSIDDNGDRNADYSLLDMTDPKTGRFEVRTQALYHAIYHTIMQFLSVYATQYIINLPVTGLRLTFL